MNQAIIDEFLITRVEDLTILTISDGEIEVSLPSGESVIFYLNHELNEGEGLPKSFKKPTKLFPFLLRKAKNEERRRSQLFEYLKEKLREFGCPDTKVASTARTMLSDIKLILEDARK